MAINSSETENQTEEVREEDILETNLICLSEEEKVPSSVPTDADKKWRKQHKQVRKFGKTGLLT